MSDSKRKISYLFYKYLTDEEISLVEEKSNLVKLNKKDTVFLQNTRTSHVMFIKSGLVKVSKECRRGRSVFLKIAATDNFLDLQSIFGDETYQISATILEPTDMLYIDITVFTQLIRTNTEFALQIIDLISKEGLFMYKRFAGMAYTQLPGKIATVLQYLSKEIYKSEKFPIDLTRKEMAEFVGTSKESFIRTLNEFKNDKIIEFNAETIEIKSMNIINTLGYLG